MDDKLRYSFYALFGTILLCVLAIIYQMTIDPVQLAAAQAVQAQAMATLADAAVSTCAGFIGLVGPIVLSVVLWRERGKKKAI